LGKPLKYHEYILVPLGTGFNKIKRHTFNCKLKIKECVDTNTHTQEWVKGEVQCFANIMARQKHIMWPLFWAK
jgi:hypothetical protein